MEDTARLAVVEQNIGDFKLFTETLLTLRDIILDILEDPEDLDSRTVEPELLEDALKTQAFTEYLSYIGFKIKGSSIVYENTTVAKLEQAVEAIEKKLHYSGVVTMVAEADSATQTPAPKKKRKLEPSHFLITSNEFLCRVELNFNGVLMYEDEELQQLARSHIPLETLQIQAMERMREHQRKIKSGAVTSKDMTFEMALLLELVAWFKGSFFSWVDRPACEGCGGVPEHAGDLLMKTPKELCRVEVYKCPSCGTETKFPRHNSLRALLKTRRGRCGEWASCFLLLCRSLGYEARRVYDVTDHVWAEVFDFDSDKWIHVDPCEAKVNAPLIYEHGWKKKLSYVLAFSCDDLQDVTWRYTTNHKEVLRRRNRCTEQQLMAAIFKLREERQQQLSPARRKYLAKRAVKELVELMVERQPSDYESEGRISGSVQWRQQRAEIGDKSHVFELQQPAQYSIRYFAAQDKYEVDMDRVRVKDISGWQNGVFNCEKMFRKEEKDWKMVYLAREEGAPSGSVSWRISTSTGVIRSLTVSASTKLYETGAVSWTLRCGDEDAVPVEITATPTTFTTSCRLATLTATLSGGRGDVGWQHSQLFRQALTDDAAAMEIQAVIEETKD
ncbi:peptide-N(4)-(N-acetyl-beta-glucosaminyl)asparagine amidase [Plutella xylostella]|uniref:peptide-N(4)-(N-acetyl-beta- glucosaminyl)asparagine amidase n=1 Tax=Plutella xylostella TaxID=51655 RepID=UPI00203314A4|nr:peptide-N(4)-(N-acetyl-beta-glucosaminyl)asparagine amidase [Plutella xylostella]